MLDIEPEEARLLLNIAMMAIGRNRFQSADAIISALERYRPSDVSLASTRAVLLISAQDFQGAIDYIDGTGLAAHPDSAMLKAFKGMAYIRMNRPDKARDPLLEAANQVADKAAAQLAEDLLK